MTNDLLKQVEESLNNWRIRRLNTKKLSMFNEIHTKIKVKLISYGYRQNYSKLYMEIHRP